MNFDLRLYPAVRLLILISIGSTIIYMTNYLIAGIIFFTISVVIYIVSKEIKCGIFYLFAFILSALIYLQIDYSNNNLPKKIIQNQTALIKGEIIKIVKTTKSYSRIIVEGKIDTKNLPPFNGKIMLTVFHYNKDIFKLDKNNRLFIKADINIPKSQILPNNFDERQYLASLGIHWTGKCNIRNISIIGSIDNGLKKFINNISDKIEQKIDLLFSGYSNQIIKATILGDKSTMAYELKQIFSLSGTAHLLAISGLHVGIIATIIYLFLGFIRNEWAKFIIFSISILLFVFITGNSPSALRAGLMAILILFIKTYQRHINLLNILAVATIIILLITPEMYFSVGFRLSFAAVLGIALLLQPILDVFNNIIDNNSIIIRYVKISLAVSLSASIGTIPIVAYYFGIFVILAPIVNLLVIPIMSFSIGFSVISIIFSFIHYPLAQIYSYASQLCIESSIIINDFFLQIPYTYLKSTDLLILATISVILFTYVIFSENLKKFAFRLMISIVLLLLTMNLNWNSQNNERIIYPSEQFLAVIFPINKSILIFDRMPAQKPQMDYSFLIYLSKQLNSNKLNKIFYSGNSSMYYVDKFKNRYKFKYVEMDLDFQKKVLKELNINNIFQKVDYE